MNWIERYIHAVKTHLPAKQRDDVGLELTALLEEELEAKEQTAGRKLEEEEIKVWLNTKDHPVLAAAGYQERQVLIGETVFPLYKKVLKIFLLILAAVTAIPAILRVINTGDYFLVGTFYDYGRYFLEKGLFGFAVITMIFHFGERSLQAKKVFKDWKLDSLPKAEKPWQTIPYSHSIPAFLFTLVFLAWVNGYLPAIIGGFRWGDYETSLMEAHFTAGFLQYLIPINSVVLASLGLYLYQIFRPCWGIPSLSINLLINLASAVLAGLLLSAGPLAEITYLSSDLAVKAEEIATVINRSISIALFVILLISLWDLIRDGYRIFQLR
jgi:hypothetical protein